MTISDNFLVQSTPSRVLIHFTDFVFLNLYFFQTSSLLFFFYRASLSCGMCYSNIPLSLQLSHLIGVDMVRLVEF